MLSGKNCLIIVKGQEKTDSFAFDTFREENVRLSATALPGYSVITKILLRFRTI